MAVLSREVRRIVVAHLTERDMDPATIADELGVSRETVRRDLLTVSPPEDPEPAAPVAVGEQGLSLPASLELGQDLRLLAASYKAPAEDVARDLLHREAERIRARVHARFTAERT